MAMRARPVTWSAEPPSWQISPPKPVVRAGLRGLRSNGRRAGHAQPWVIVCAANLRGHAARSSWKQHLSAGPRHAAQTGQRMKTFMKEWELSSNRAAPPGSTLVTWRTDYPFTLSMNMNHPSRFNPALLSRSTRPIVGRIFAAGSRGWAFRRTRMNIVILWMRVVFSDDWQVTRTSKIKNSLGGYY